MAKVTYVIAMVGAKLKKEPVMANNTLTQTISFINIYAFRDINSITL